MKLLIDTNVILDMVLNRGGCDISMDLFRKAKETGASAYITASSVTDIYYIITANCKDYADALLPVMTPEAWIEMAGNMQKNK